MPAPTGRYTADLGKIEVQATTALRGVSDAFVLADDTKWIDISDYVKQFMPGSPAARSSTQEYNASTRTAMTSRSQIVPNHTPSMVLYDQNGTAAAFAGIAGNLELRADVFQPALANDIALPLRWSKIGTTGKPQYTYGNCFVMRIEQGGINPGETGSDTYTVAFDAETMTEAVVV